MPTVDVSLTASVPSEQHAVLRDEQLNAVHKVLLRYCGRLTGSTAGAEDLAQETMVRALPFLMGSQPHPNATAYLFCIAKNVWTDVQKRRGIERRYQVQLACQETGVVQDDPATGVASEEAISMLLTHLTARQLSIYLLRDILAYSTSEVAQLMKMTETAVKASLRRARSHVGRIRESEMGGHRSQHTGGLVAPVLLQAYVHAVRRGDTHTLLQLAQVDATAVLRASERVLGMPLQKVTGRPASRRYHAEGSSRIPGLDRALAA
ncbi:RNA polymerase sigma factor [Alicyclobacillus fastidiosus]|uniref:RNA polymerase sigma factor n=1 Tax=Alicyclobacillus fastidiosus TaxID=392011 RepID=A0ABY6ZG84_9BACL|nr:RNA polymerase sigma factor [Alicyclobacillus fastidiosus]WAH41918.1 RNA polymerase sigma factor [Alicyclobacillus fastidiosus]GMA63634.1 hypothetical protein GCM10025859_40740 [Alicyclobacillus fastidiosus]